MTGPDVKKRLVLAAVPAWSGPGPRPHLPFSTARHSYL